MPSASSAAFAAAMGSRLPSAIARRTSTKNFSRVVGTAPCGKLRQRAQSFAR